MTQKIEDINQKENLQTSTVQNIDFRLRKVEDSAEQILSHLAVIHRFMSMHTNGADDLKGSMSQLPGDFQRVRTISMSDNDTANPTQLHALPQRNSLQVTTRRRFNRSLTEVRPDAYIFDEGTHFEVVPVPEEADELMKSREAIIEPPASLTTALSRQSESDSEAYVPLSKRPSTCDTVKRTPYVTIRQDTGASTESHDTLTPLGNNDENTIVGESTDETAPETNIEARRRAIRQRTVSLCRRNSETCSAIPELNRSHISLNQLTFSRRQMSLTHSEPDSDKEIVTASMDKPKNDMSNAERAALLEKQHLKECEENDYMMMEGLFEARSSLDDAISAQYVMGLSIDYTHRYPLRRETAVELSPSKPRPDGDPIGGNSSDTSAGDSRGGGGGIRTIGAFPWQRNASMESQQQTYQASVVGPPRAASDFLNPPYETSGGRLFKKSSESLQKNSSTETDYSAHPYRFIKQSSNETTTSMTGSYNIDTPSLTAEASLDVPGILTVTKTTSEHHQSSGLVAGINAGRYQPLRTSSVGAADLRRRRDDSTVTSLDYGLTGHSLPQPPPQRAMHLQKHYSQMGQIRPQSLHQQTSMTATASGDSTKSLNSMSSLKPPNPQLDASSLKESSSSNDDVTTTVMPKISTDLVQDEIAKLSSNIKSSTESEKDPPFNETMC